VIGVEFTVLALLWSVGLARLARRQPSAPYQVMTVGILAIALAAALREPPLAQALDRASGVADLSALLRTLSGVAACAAVWVLTSAVNRPGQPRPYWRPVLYLTAIALMAALTGMFLAIERLPGPGWFGDEQGGAPLVVRYGIVAHLAYVAGAARGAVLFWTKARSSGRTLLRTGLLLLSGAAGVFLIYLGLRMSCLITHALGVRPLGGLLDEPRLATAEQHSLTFALLLFAVGCALPGLAVARDYLADYRALVRLFWLWDTLQLAVPGFVLGRAPSRLGDLLNPFGVRMRLYRRVIEIRDAQWSLGAPVDPDPSSEAAVLVVALSIAGKAGPQRWRIGHSSVRRFAGRARSSAGPASPLDREVEHLLQVAEYFESAFRMPGGLNRPQRPVAPVGPVSPPPRQRRAPERVRFFRIRDVGSPALPPDPFPADPFPADHGFTCNQGP